MGEQRHKSPVLFQLSGTHNIWNHKVAKPSSGPQGSFVNGKPLLQPEPAPWEGSSGDFLRDPRLPQPADTCAGAGDRRGWEWGRLATAGKRFRQTAFSVIHHDFLAAFASHLEAGI